MAWSVLPTHSLAPREQHAGTPRKASRGMAQLGLLALGDGKTESCLLGHDHPILNLNISEKKTPLPETWQSRRRNRLHLPHPRPAHGAQSLFWGQRYFKLVCKNGLVQREKCSSFTQ